MMRLLEFLSRCDPDTWLEIQNHYYGFVRRLNAAKFQDAIVAFWGVRDGVLFIQLGRGK